MAGEEAGPKSNKLGGVWNVIDAEAKKMAEIASEEIIVVGPYFERLGQDWSPKNRITHAEFDDAVGSAIDEAAKRVGLPYVTGKIGKVNYVLFNVEHCLGRIVRYDNQDMRLSDAVKAEAYRLVGLDSLRYEATSYGREYTHYLNLSYAVSEFTKALLDSGKVSLHCHEYPVFYAIARLEKLKIPVKTVATFHATKIGRALGVGVFDKIRRGDPTYPPNIQHGLVELEKLAKYAETVTFVSEGTRAEAKLFYGIDGLVIRNGIEVTNEIIDWEKKTECLNRIRSTIVSRLSRYNGIELEEEQIIPIYTISRLELENKGYPDLMDALVILDRILTNRIENGEIEEVKVFCLLITAFGYKDPSTLPEGFPVELPDEILVGDELRLKKMVEKRKIDVGNLKKRAVCAMPYPQWVGRNDGGFGMTIDEIAAGCVAGIFPSRYEPFLLTALEACSEACPVVISRACGFSGAVKELQRRKGIFGGVILVDNIEQSYLETITDYAFGLHIIIDALLRDRAKDKMMCSTAFVLANEMSWDEPVGMYYEILRE
ncbi:hypothetical protein [Archaeoglobus veneficus]|uniref:hypothetical protein n=1 Tax=Archaeoglobus veneficus TaxID=58290 RepID=UPI0022B2ABD2|nr:hypothetical protein [Archaeoglobus veneficus]